MLGGIFLCMWKIYPFIYFKVASALSHWHDIGYFFGVVTALSYEIVTWPGSWMTVDNKNYAHRLENLGSFSGCRPKNLKHRSRWNMSWVLIIILLACAMCIRSFDVAVEEAWMIGYVRTNRYLYIQRYSQGDVSKNCLAPWSWFGVIVYGLGHLQHKLYINDSYTMIISVIADQQSFTSHAAAFFSHMFPLLKVTHFIGGPCEEEKAQLQLQLWYLVMYLFSFFFEVACCVVASASGYSIVQEFGLKVP